MKLTTSVWGLRDLFAILSWHLRKPAHGTFLYAAELSKGRSLHTATLLDDGRVLIAGGLNHIRPEIVRVGQYRSLAEVEIFDPNTFALTQLKMMERRDSHTATRLLDGRVLVIGGRRLARAALPGTSLFTSEIFDSATGAFTIGPDLGVPRYAHTATLLPDGRVLVLGGISAGFDTGNPTQMAAYAISWAEIFEADGKGRRLLDSHMRQPRFGHTAVLDANAGRVYIDGGAYPATNPIPSEYFDIATEQFMRLEDSPLGLRRHHCAITDNGQRVLVGGEALSWLDGYELSGAYPLNVDVAPTPKAIALRTPRAHHTATRLRDGNVLITGGLDSKSTLDSAEILTDPFGANPASWGIGSIQGDRVDHTATLLPDGAVVIVGGLTIDREKFWWTGLSRADILIYVNTTALYSKYKLSLGGIR